LLVHGTRQQVDRRLRSGLLARMYNSVYRLSSAPVTWRQSLLAACLAGGKPSAASCRAAAKISDLPGGEEVLEITSPRHRRAQYGGVVAHESRFLEERDVVVIDGIPVTRTARTICDLAGLVELGLLDRTTLDLALQEAVRRNLVDVAAVWREHERLGSTFRLGGAVMLSALHDFVPPARRTESVGESKVLLLLRRNDFPEPVSQYWLTLPDGERIRLDHAWPECKASIEFDPYKWHGGCDHYEKMLSRTRRMRAMDWERISVTDTDLDAGMPEALAALARIVPRLGRL
jgi:hypothetical protein